VLLVICAVAAAVLAAVDGITSDRIAAQTAARVQQALKHVLPEADEFKDATEVLLQVKAETSAQGKPFLAIVDRMYIGYSQDEQRGFVFICLPSGYGGVIETAVGVSSDGNVRGVSIIRHSETPGLGSQITGSDFLERCRDGTQSPECGEASHVFRFQCGRNLWHSQELPWFQRLESHRP
jgi:electron transport complex protein RnfG